MTYVDLPNTKEKHPHYDHCTTKLDNNNFTSKKFQHFKNNSTHKKIFKSFQRIGMCLNSKPTKQIPNNGDLDKVCFVVINDYENVDGELGVGPLNDGYLFALNHHRIGFKIFYLYNCPMDEFLIYLEFLMKNCNKYLTVFYSGRDNKAMDGIEFMDGSLERSEVNEVIANICNPKKRFLFMTDCPNGGSIFDIKGCTNAISLFVQKKGTSFSKDEEQTQGIITYYFCKIIKEYPEIDPVHLVEKMNQNLSRFNESFAYELSNQDLATAQILP